MLVPNPSSQPGDEHPLRRHMRGRESSRNESPPSLPPAPLNSDPILRQLSLLNTPLSNLARRLLTGTFYERVQIINTPLSKSGLTPLYMSVTPTWERLCRDLPAEFVKQLPHVFLELGADPFKRDPRGRTAVLSNSFLESPAIFKLLLQYHKEDLAGPTLTREEKIWLYLAGEKTLWLDSYRPLAHSLLETLFPSNQPPQFRHGPSFKTPRHHLKPGGIPQGERILLGLTRLESRGIMSKEELSTLLDTCHGNDGELLVHRFIRTAPLINRTLPQLLALGASPAARTNERSLHPGATVWHIAAKNSALLDEVRKHLRPNPNIMDTTDALGNTPLHIYLTGHNDLFAGPMRVLIGDGSPLHRSNDAGEFPLDIALKRDLPAEVLILRDLDAPIGDNEKLAEKLRFIESHADFFRNGVRMAIDAALRGYNDLPANERALFSEALRAITTPDKDSWPLPQDRRKKLAPDAPKTALARLLPNLILSPDASIIRHLTNVFDGFAGDGTSKSPFHPNESELLAMLARPQLLEQAGANLHAVVFGVTSLRRFDLNHVRHVDDQVLHLWADVGAAGFEFLNIKFDARRFSKPDGSTTTLLESYGFERTDLPPVTHSQSLMSMNRKGTPHSQSAFICRGERKPYAARIQKIGGPDGARRLVTRLNAQTEFEFTRFFLRIYHPEHGEFILRNSAPDGGRDTLLHPAYIISESRRALAAGRDAAPGLQRRWSPYEIEHFFSDVLSVSLYPNGHLGRDMQSARFLLNQYRTLMRDYRTWMCDLSEHTAYLDDPTSGKRYLVGAYRSPGFQTLLRATSHWVSTGTPVELAFCRRDFPAWNEYARLQMTPEVVRELWKLSNGSFNSPKLRSSGVYDFIQSGLNSFGDLIIRSAEQRGT